MLHNTNHMTRNLSLAGFQACIQTLLRVSRWKPPTEVHRRFVFANGGPRPLNTLLKINLELASSWTQSPHSISIQSHQLKTVSQCSVPKQLRRSDRVTPSPLVRRPLRFANDPKHVFSAKGSFARIHRHLSYALLCIMFFFSWAHGFKWPAEKFTRCDDSTLPVNNSI